MLKKHMSCTCYLAFCNYILVNIRIRHNFIIILCNDDCKSDGQLNAIPHEAPLFFILRIFCTFLSRKKENVSLFCFFSGGLFTNLVTLANY